LHRASTVSKHFFIIPTDAHNYKLTGILKQLKFPQLLKHVSVQSGTIIKELFRAYLKLQLRFYMFVVNDVVQACGTRVPHACTQADMPPSH
jgi:hypothetical protein